VSKRTNPFKQPWNRGYDDGIEGRPFNPENLILEAASYYLIGYECGERERRELKDDYSSNT
jgi:hypothetical protein